MTNPNFDIKPWPQMPEDHPEALWTDIERAVEPREMDEATKLMVSLLDEHEAKWSIPKKQSNVRRRGIKLPLDLEGIVVLSETIKNGHQILEVRKDQMDEITVWRWIGTGESQYWHRRYIVPGSKTKDIRHEDEPLTTNDVSGLGYSLVMLHRLEDTLLELSTLPDHQDEQAAEFDASQNSRLARIEKAAQDSRVIKLFEELQALDVRADSSIRQQFLSEMSDLLEQIGEEYELAFDELMRMSEIARTNLSKQENDDGQA